MGTPPVVGKDAGLDELINQTIRRARSVGYSLQALRQRVRERLLEEPADHPLVVEHEKAIREIIRHEISKQLAWPTEGCSYEDLVADPALAIGAQVLTPSYLAAELKPFIPLHRPCVSITYSNIEEHLQHVAALKDPSIIAVASVSESLLKTARSLLASCIGREHTYREVLIHADQPTDLRGADLVFCDSLALPLVTCARKRTTV